MNTKENKKQNGAKEEFYRISPGQFIQKTEKVMEDICMEPGEFIESAEKVESLPQEPIPETKDPSTRTLLIITAGISLIMIAIIVLVNCYI